MKPRFSDHWSCDNPIKNGKVLRKTKCEIACLQGFDWIAGMPQFEILLNFDIWNGHGLTQGYKFSVREALIKMKSVLWQIYLIIFSSIIFYHFPMSEKQVVKSKRAPGTAWVLRAVPLIRSASKYIFFGRPNYNNSPRPDLKTRMSRKAAFWECRQNDQYGTFQIVRFAT